VLTNEQRRVARDRALCELAGALRTAGLLSTDSAELRGVAWRVRQVDLGRWADPALSLPYTPHYVPSPTPLFPEPPAAPSRRRWWQRLKKGHQ
jgi:hypothetical protein